jgi:hypothetical protein
MRNLHKLQKDGHILGLTNIIFEKDRPCGAFQAGKQVRAHHHAKNIITTTKPLKMLHMDLFGSVAYISIGGNNYGLVMVDDYSHFTWVFFLQDKNETQEVQKKIFNVSYFRVFRSKCYILQKWSKSSKFAPKTYEGFLLGYDSNCHAYRVFNVTTSCVETTCDAVFDVTNGSQKKQVDLDLLDDEEAPCDAL